MNQQYAKTLILMAAQRARSWVLSTVTDSLLMGAWMCATDFTTRKYGRRWHTDGGRNSASLAEVYVLLSVLQAGWRQRERGEKEERGEREGGREKERERERERERGRGLRLRPLTVDEDGAAGLRIDSPTM